MRSTWCVFVLSAISLTGGCATYESKPVPVRPASSYALQARPQHGGIPIQPQYVQPQMMQAAPVTGQPAAPVQQMGATLQPQGQPLPQAGAQMAPQQVPGQVMPYQPVSYAGAGLAIGADVLSDPVRCKEYFGVDLNKAGVLPVLLVYTNSGNHAYNAQRGQVFAVDYDNNMWQALTTEQATERIAGSEVGQDLAMGAGKGALIGGAGGAALGAALGAVMGDAGKGAMIGAAAGGIGGGAYGSVHEKSKVEQVVTRDVMSKAFQDQQVSPGYTTSGFIFLPKGNYHRIDINVFDASLQQSVQYTITPQASF